MRRRKKHKNAFTILELVIVIIIVGILASLALPKFVRMIELARSVEAISILRNIRIAVERCRLMSGSGNSCDCTLGNTPPFLSGIDWDKLGMEDPSTTPNAHFFYQAGQCGGLPEVYPYSICATRNTLEGGDPGQNGPNNYLNTICLQYSELEGAKVFGLGIYSSLGTLK